jgi:hypothetical protein
MITPSFSITATERILPKLALDFTTASLDPRVTFTRTGNTATVVNSSGFVETINADLPRFDFNPVTLSCNGLLIEESRTNLITYSDIFGDVIWVKSNSFVLGNQLTSPAGIVTGYKLVENSATNFHFISHIFISVGGIYTSSVYAKVGERKRFVIRESTTTGNGSIFDLSTGTVISNLGGGVGSIIDAGNGWYRCSMTATETAGTRTIALYLAPDNATTIANCSYTGNGTSGIFVWGAQVEAGAFSTSYIPTEATTITRNADVATMTGANFSDWYSTGAGGAVARVLPSIVSGTRPVLQFDDATANEVIVLRGNTTNPELVIVDGGSPQTQIDAGTISANTAYNLGSAWNTDNCAAAVNGGAAVTDTSATIPTVTQARLGSDGTNYLNGNIQTLRYWPQRIIDAEVQAFSK